MEIKIVCPQTRAPRNGDTGACAVGRYYVSDGVLVMCDEIGKPTGKTHRPGPNDDERLVACRLTLEAYRATARASDFNRPLNYSRHGVA
jgi:hypothetical protein